jgi:hypothetical protein
VSKAVRHMLFAGRGTAAYVVVFDQVTSTNATFVKRWLLHTVNQPVVNGSAFTVTRSELTTELPFNWTRGYARQLKYCPGSDCTSGNQYQYAGKLYGWMVQPQAGVITLVGGPGKEFWVEDPLHPGTGTNWNQCMQGQCAANTEGLGPVTDMINPVPADAPHDPGSWRIEEKPAAANTQDFFLNVMLATTATDTNVPQNVTVPAGLAAGMVGATWSDSNGTYTITLPQTGVGGHIKITGLGVDEDLLSQAQPLPDQMQIVSGTPQSAAANAHVPAPLVVLALDSAGNPFPNAIVHFGITAGTGLLSADSATTDGTGKASVTFTMGAGTAGSVTTVMADINGLQPVEFDFTVTGTGGAPPALSSVSCSPANLSSAGTASCTVSLTQVTGSGGVTVTLSSSSSTLTVPVSVLVPSGSSAASFTATAGTISTGQTAIVTATYSGLSKTVTMTLAIPIISPSALNSVSCLPASLSSAGAASCAVALSQAAGSGGVMVTLLSNSPTLVVPASVLVRSGSIGVSFTALAGTVSSSMTATITATYSGVSKTTILMLTVPIVTPLVLNSVSCSPPSLFSGTTSLCTAALSQAAASGGATVTLSSNSPTLAVPLSVLVPSGSANASFTATALTISSGQTAVITAMYSGVSKTANINLLTTSSGGTPIPANTWLMVPTHGYPAQTVGFEKLIYAPSPVKKAVFLGNYHNLGSEPNQALLAYDFDTNRWNVLDIGASFHSENMPDSGHPVGAFAYDPNQQTFVYYCCASGSNQPENVYYTWWFDPVGQTGRNKETSPKPGQLLQEGSAFDVTNRTYVMMGSGTWTYTPTTNTYRHQSPSGTLPNSNVNLPSMTYNSTNGKVYLMGGQIGSSFSNDLFTYDVPTNTWTKLSPTGTLPAPRWRHGFAYDSTNNIFLLFGGQDASKIYNDTWVYDPAANAWTQILPAQFPPVGAVGPFEKLAYDPDHNVFILVASGTGGNADGIWSGYAAQTWFYRYQGAGPNVGTLQSTFQPAAGGINRNSDAWAKEPTLAGAGNTLYAAWVETGKPFDSSLAGLFHVYGQQLTSGVWSTMGGAATSMDPEFSNHTESHSPSIAVVGGRPWASWYKWNTSGAVNTLWSLWAKSWDGSTWQGGVIGPGGSNTTKVYQGRSQMVDVAGVPHIAFLEVDKNVFPQETLVYVKYWNGTQWVLKGTGPLNTNVSAITTAGSVSIASDGTNPYVAWTEYTSDKISQNQTFSQAYASRWNGSQWVPVGASLNVDAGNWADDTSIAFTGGQPYVAWTERSLAGNNQVFVKTFNGATWVLAGLGSLNKDGNTGWAFRPSLAADILSGNLYLGWIEQQALGQPAQTYVSRFFGGTWTALGSSLNANPATGSSVRVSMAVAGGQPAAAWGEVNLGSQRQIFVKQWNGSDWVQKGGTALSCDVNGDGSTNIADVQVAVNQALGLVSCTTAALQQNGLCNVIDVQRVIAASLGGSCLIGP